MNDSPAEPLPTGVRSIRRLAGPPEAPWPGLLVHDGSGAPRVLVAATRFDAESPVWCADADGHVLAAIDVVRRVDGHDVLLPLCTQTLERLLARRRDGAPLTDGERVTVAVSVLRGFAELHGRGRADATGTWWITADARPVFAAGSGTDAAGVATVRVLDALAADSPGLGPLLARAADYAGDPPRLARELAALEDALFAASDAEPLATAVLAPRSEARRADSAVVTRPAQPGEERVGLWRSLARHVDADLADVVSRVTTDVWRRMRRPARGRRRGPWVAATVVAAAVVAGAMLLPAVGGEASAVDSTPSPMPSLTPSPAPAAETAPPETAPPAAPEASVEDIVTALLDARRACAGDPGCLGEVQEDSAMSAPSGPIDLEPASRNVTLLDDFGDVAVVRVDGLDGDGAQLVVVAAHDGKWLLRDVHDVAQQP